MSLSVMVGYIVVGAVAIVLIVFGFPVIGNQLTDRRGKRHERAKAKEEHTREIDRRLLFDADDEPEPSDGASETDVPAVDRYADRHDFRTEVGVSAECDICTEEFHPKTVIQVFVGKPETVMIADGEQEYAESVPVGPPKTVTLCGRDTCLQRARATYGAALDGEVVTP